MLRYPPTRARMAATALALALSGTPSCMMTFRRSPPSAARVSCIDQCNVINDDCCFSARDSLDADLCDQEYDQCENRCPK